MKKAIYCTLFSLYLFLGEQGRGALYASPAFCICCLLSVNSGGKDNKMKKIYLKNEKKFVEVTDEVYYTYYRPIWAARKKAQSHGQCVCPQNKLWQCDADCCDCIYRTTGDMRSLDYEITIGEEGDIVTAGDMIADDYDMESLIADRMLLGKLLEELERLDPDGKKIFELFGEGLSDRKIGQALGRNENTFKSQLRKIRETLKKLI